MRTLQTRSLFDFFEYTKHKNIIQTKEQFTWLMSKLSKVKEFSLDTETTSLKRKLLEVVVISFAWREGKRYEGAAIPFMFNVGSEHPFLRVTDVHKRLTTVIKRKKVIFHNASYDFHVLEKYQLPIKIDFEDTMLMHYVLDSEEGNSLKKLAQVELGERAEKFKDVVGKRDIRDVPYPEVCSYAIDDAVYTLRLYDKYKPRLAKSPVLKKVYDKIDKPYTYVVIEMEREGVSIDEDRLEKVRDLVNEDLVNIERKCRRLLKVSRQFNLKSTKQLGEHLYGVLKIKCPAYTDEGTPKTDMKTLKKLGKKHKGVEELIKYKSLQKLKGDFVDGIAEQLERTNDGKIYGGYKAVGTRTGRLSSSDPNLQNIPARDEYGFRKIFVAAKGRILDVEDYSQLELRIAAVLSKDPVMLSAFNNNEDIHQTVADMCNCSRDEAKKVSFGVLYGMGRDSLVEQIFQATGKWITPSTASEYIENFKTRFRGVFNFMQRSVSFARSHGYCETLFKRRRPLNNILSSDGFLRSGDERKSYNTPVQGTGGDMTKLAQIHFQRERDKAKLDAKLIMQVHDEIVIDVKKKDAKKAQALLRKCMSKVIKSKMPLDFCVDGKVSRSWGEAKG